MANILNRVSIVLLWMLLFTVAPAEEKAPAQTLITNVHVFDGVNEPLMRHCQRQKDINAL